MYLIINPDYTLTQSAILTGRLRMLARQGKISLVDCRKMRGLNKATYEGGDWSDIPMHSHDTTEPEA